MHETLASTLEEQPTTHSMFIIERIKEKILISKTTTTYDKVCYVSIVCKCQGYYNMKQLHQGQNKDIHSLAQ